MSSSSSSPPSARDLLAVARAWVAANYGKRLRFLTLHIRKVKVPVRLAAGPDADPGLAPEPDERGPGLRPCTADILAVLQAAAPNPLTKTRILQALAERNRRGEGGEWSERTVIRRLNELMEDGTISNPPDARPRGYRLQE